MNYAVGIVCQWSRIANTLPDSCSRAKAISKAEAEFALGRRVENDFIEFIAKELCVPVDKTEEQDSD